MYNQKEIINRDISKSQFEFLQKDEKIYDQAIQGKPIGYLQDVWIRFRKNRTNLTASIILLILIICSLTMPALSGKDYKKLDEKLAYLPPRVPVIEKLGILDGITDHEDMPVNLDYKDEETGLYLPQGYLPNAILMDTLENYTITSTEKKEIVLHGQTVFKLDPGETSISTQAPGQFNFDPTAGTILELDIFDLTDGKVEVLAKASPASDFEVVATITEAGVHQINVFDTESFAGQSFVFTPVILRYSSDVNANSFALTHLKVTNPGTEEPVYFAEGYNLSQFELINGEGKGAVLRQNGELIVSKFKYNKYVAAFGLTHEIAFPSSKYDELIAKYGDKAVQYPNPNNPDGWFFEEGFPIREVVKKNDSLFIDGVEYSSYEVYLDYKTYLGYDELPYFLFGTSAAGRDLFSLVWVGLRTSLFIGVVVTFINVSVGIIYGAIEGFYGGLVDLLMQRFSEVVGRTPWLVVLSIMVVLFDPGITTLILTLIISGWISTASTTRMQFYRYKGREYVLASRTMGARDGRLIFKHILPNGIGTIITASVLGIPGVIFTEAVLSYLGYGVGHGQSFKLFGLDWLEFSGVSIGVLLSDGRNALRTYPHLTIFPAIIISILMITFNMFGNALRDAFNPSLRGVE